MPPETVLPDCTISWESSCISLEFKETTKTVSGYNVYPRQRCNCHFLTAGSNIIRNVPTSSRKPTKAYDVTYVPLTSRR